VHNAANELEEDVTSRSVPEAIPAASQAALIGPAPDTVLPWSKEGLQKSQRVDSDIGFVIGMLEEKSEKPPWEAAAMKSQVVKTFWGNVGTPDPSRWYIEETVRDFGWIE
jgi:hypothetical protein